MHWRSRKVHPDPEHLVIALAAIIILFVAIVLLVVLASRPAAAAIPCQSAKGSSRHYWSWREIDGRRCWYVGRRGMSKSRLSWVRVVKHTPAPARPRRRPPPPVPAPDEDDILLYSVWPEPPRPDSFSDRWGDR